MSGRGHARVFMPRRSVSTFPAPPRGPLLQATLAPTSDEQPNPPPRFWASTSAHLDVARTVQDEAAAGTRELHDRDTVLVELLRKPIWLSRSHVVVTGKARLLAGAPFPRECNQTCLIVSSSEPLALEPFCAVLGRQIVHILLEKINNAVTGTASAGIGSRSAPRPRLAHIPAAEDQL